MICFLFCLQTFSEKLRVPFYLCLLESVCLLLAVLHVVVRSSQTTNCSLGDFTIPVIAETILRSFLFCSSFCQKFGPNFPQVLMAYYEVGKQICRKTHRLGFHLRKTKKQLVHKRWLFDSMLLGWKTKISRSNSFVPSFGLKHPSLDRKLTRSWKCTFATNVFTILVDSQSFAFSLVFFRHRNPFFVKFLNTCCLEAPANWNRSMFFQLFSPKKITDNSVILMQLREVILAKLLHKLEDCCDFFQRLCQFLEICSIESVNFAHQNDTLSQFSCNASLARDFFHCLMRVESTEIRNDNHEHPKRKCNKEHCMFLLQGIQVFPKKSCCCRPTSRLTTFPYNRQIKSQCL